MEFKNISLSNRMAHYNIPGISMAVISNGELEWTKEYGVLEAKTDHQVTNDCLFHACSMSKLATTITVLKLVEMGILDLDQDVNEKLKAWKIPENQLTQDKKVTLRRLLSHQAGFIDPEGSFGIYEAAHIFPSMLDILEGKTAYYPKSVEVEYEPEGDFKYSDMGFCIIEQLLTDVTGKPFDLLMEELTFKPLDMRNSVFKYPFQMTENDCVSCGHDKEGNVVEGKRAVYPYLAAAGLWSTPTDLSKLLIEITNLLNGKGILGISQNLIEEMVKPQGCSEWTGLGVFLDKIGADIEIASNGWGVGFQCMIIAYPYIGAGAVIMTNSDPGVSQLKSLIGELIKELAVQCKWPSC